MRSQRTRWLLGWNGACMSTASAGWRVLESDSRGWTGALHRVTENGAKICAAGPRVHDIERDRTSEDPSHRFALRAPRDREKSG
ncbi:hypothetical protein B0H16DRAFT_1550561 [Mycena metata]|uniref:Uncharacterized protein n=1 Tax=Mycena metata TaxID=1033252 RepID=A0AAD7IV90_9AGAR|nr:hypothetical protein B0H16DRAFT_1550561 [Mycena metata]